MKYVGGIVFLVGCVMILSYLFSRSGGDANVPIIGFVLLIVGVLIGFRDYRRGEQQR